MSHARQPMFILAMAFTATLLAPIKLPAEPAVSETVEGGSSVVRIRAMGGTEKVYRIDLMKFRSSS